MRTIEISHASKIMFPKSRITKGQLAMYYEEISEYMLPYLADRPLTMHRFPKGIHHDGFYQKNAPDYFPEWIKTVNIRKEGGWINHVLCNTKESLLYLVNQGVVTFHITLSKVDKLNYPDKLIFDLDPSGNDFKSVVNGAKKIRVLLEDLELSPYVKLTGSQGLHLVIPLVRGENFDEVRSFAKKVADYVIKKHPGEFTTALRKDKRKGKLFIDYLRNSYSQTAVCPFSVRALEGAPVAVPIGWDELENGLPNSRVFDIKSVIKRLKDKADPWATFNKEAKSICYGQKKLTTLMEQIIPKSKTY